jgi:hypothetical protein
MVPLQARSALRAGVPADGQALHDQRLTARTGLRGDRRVDRYDLLPSLCRFESEDAQDPTPARVGYCLGAGMVLEQVGHLQRLMKDS